VCESAQVEEFGWEEETKVKKWLPSEGQLGEAGCWVSKDSQEVCQGELAQVEELGWGERLAVLKTPPAEEVGEGTMEVVCEVGPVLLTKVSLLDSAVGR
jgi:hypothetical protein